MKNKLRAALFAALVVQAPTTLSNPLSSSADDQAAVAWSQVSSEGSPTGRHENSAATVGDELFLLGGRGERPVDILDLKTGKWRQGAKPPREINHAQAVTFEGKIYILGALTGPFPQEDVVPRIMIYDPASDAWSEGAELPEDRRRGGGGVVVSDGKFYMVGGNRLGHNSGFVPWLDSFDPKAGTWEVLPDAPRPRDHFHAVVQDGKIYAAGGRTSAQDKGEPLALTVAPMDVFDLATRSWSTVQDPIPTPRAGVSVAAVDGLIVVMGGESDKQKAAHNQVEAFDPKTNAWVTLPPLPVGRHGTQAIVAGNELHMIAGSRDAGGGPELTDHWKLGGF